MRNCSRGFTLIEVSIVITIIALLISGVVAGKTLMESAELKSVIAGVNEYKAAVRQFELNYDGLPGDINDASSYFAGVNNGDNDGRIDPEYIDGTGIVPTAQAHEPFEAVRQLVAADIVNIKGNLDGTWGPGFSYTDEIINGNVPYLEDDVLIYVKCCSNTDDNTRSISFNNHIALFAINSNSNYRDGVFTPLQASNIDSKIDDGIPDNGMVGSGPCWDGSDYETVTPCYTGAGATSSYQVANDAFKNRTGCQMQFAYDWD